MKLLKAEQNLAEWQAATHARIGMLRALNRNVERTFNPDRKESHWGKRKLKSEQ
jgi:hypothetical protein